MFFIIVDVLGEGDLSLLFKKKKGNKKNSIMWLNLRVQFFQHFLGFIGESAVAFSFVGTIFLQSSITPLHIHA